MGRSQATFTGTAGVYYVMYHLTRLGIHAAVTHGNAPAVDILAAAANGAETLAIQVKTAVYATRERGRGAEKAPYQLQFPLGAHSAALASERLIFAFVDLYPFDRSPPPEVLPTPDCYIVPSTTVHGHCKDWIDQVPWVRFHRSIEWMAPYKNKWQPVLEALATNAAPLIPEIDDVEAAPSDGRAEALQVSRRDLNHHSSSR
jgi:hypothetical protein